MGSSTGSAAILFYCIIYVVALSSSMVVVGGSPLFLVGGGPLVVRSGSPPVVGSGSPPVPVVGSGSPPVVGSGSPPVPIVGSGSPPVPVVGAGSPPVVGSGSPPVPIVGSGSPPVVGSGSPPVVGSAATPEQPQKFISMGALECSDNITRTKASRKLVAVQGNGVCPVRFDHTRGISAVTSSCKDRPLPSAERCCGALKTYACPYSELINDNANNGCASEMFYVIMVRGRLRPGLFSQLCVEGPLGLQC